MDELDAPPGYRPDRPHRRPVSWTTRLTWLVSGAFTTAIAITVGVIVFDGTSRTAAIASLLGVTGQLLAVALVYWFRHDRR